MARIHQRQPFAAAHTPAHSRRRSRARTRKLEEGGLPPGFSLRGELGRITHPDTPAAQRQEAAGTLGALLGNRQVMRLLRRDGTNPEEALIRAGGRLPPILGEPVKKEGIEDERLPPLAVRADLSFANRTGRENGRLEGARQDAVMGELAYESGIHETLEPGPEAFGEEEATIGIDQVRWSTEGGTIGIQGRVYVDCAWGVQSLGNTDIPNAQAEAVNAHTWAEIAADLTPNEEGIPPRNLYWAEDLTARHEQFHAKDDIEKAEEYLPTAQARLEGQQVSRHGAAESVTRLLEGMRSDIQGEVEEHYADGGEERAYEDGKAGYQARAQAVARRGERSNE